MAMAPGNQAIVGGTVLRIPAIQSPDYVPGVSGWIIRQDGTAEFNAGTFRGSIEVGSLTGQHFWVNNPNTGDVIDVYNSSNKLVFSIDATGRLVATSSVSTANVVINGANLLFEDTGQFPQFPPFMNGIISADETTLEILGGIPQNAAGGVQQAELQLNTGDAQSGAWLNATQRGVSGAVLQLDTNTSAGQLVHMERHTAISTNTNGEFTITHGAQFTPTYIFPIEEGTNATGFGIITMYMENNSYTSSTFKGVAFSGTAKFASGAFNGAFLLFG